MRNSHYLGVMMNKEQRVEQLTQIYVRAIKGLEDGLFHDCMLIPFREDEKIEVVTTTADGNKSVTVVNAPF